MKQFLPFHQWHIDLHVKCFFSQDLNCPRLTCYGVPALAIAQRVMARHMSLWPWVTLSSCPMDPKGLHCSAQLSWLPRHCSPNTQAPPCHLASTCALLCASLVWPGKGPCLQHSFCSPCLVRPSFLYAFPAFSAKFQIFHSTSARAPHWMPDIWTEKKWKQNTVFVRRLGDIFRKDVNLSCILESLYVNGLVLYA